MKTLRDLVSEAFGRAFEKSGLDPTLANVTHSQRPDLGQFQCNGALPAAKKLKQNPRITAQTILDNLEGKDRFARLTVDGPGFINIALSDSFLSECLNAAAADKRLGCPPSEHPRKTVIDFGGPNVAKPMHVGHLRSSIIGDSLQRILRFCGEPVTSDIHLGDWGLQMGMLITEVQREKPDLPYFDMNFTGPYPETSPVSISDLEAMYPRAAKRCSQDEQATKAAQQATVELQQGRPGYRALWKHFVNLSKAALQADFGRLGVQFDLWKGESDYQEKLPGLVGRFEAEGYSHRSEGALVVEVPPGPKGEEIPPLLLVKTDGGYLYATTDLATIEERVHELGAKRILYVVDKRQGLHFRQVFAVAKKSGIASDVELAHVGFGTVNGPDGKPFKTRAGGVMRLESLISEVVARAHERMKESGIAEGFAAQEREEIAAKVGLATLKYADLMNHRESDYIFDLDRFSSFDGNTGPYLLYACVRIKSILRKASERGITGGVIFPPAERERDLVLTLLRLPEAIDAAAREYAPHHLCEFANTLAQSFNHFYKDCHILNEPNQELQKSWISLSAQCLAELELVLDLLGLSAPERM